MAHLPAVVRYLVDMFEKSETPTGGVIDAQLVLDASVESGPTPRRRPAHTWNQPARMPERFGMGLMLIALGVVSLAFCILRLLDAPPSLVFFLTLLFTLIAIAQMLFPRIPRKASVIAGAVFCPLWALLVGAGMLLFKRQQASIDEWAIYSVMTTCALPFGGLFGYLAGGLVAGIFLFLGWTDSPDTHADEVVRPTVVDEPVLELLQSHISDIHAHDAS